MEQQTGDCSAAIAGCSAIFPVIARFHKLVLTLVLFSRPPGKCCSACESQIETYSHVVCKWRPRALFATGKVQQQTNEFNNNDHQRKQRGHMAFPAQWIRGANWAAPAPALGLIKSASTARLSAHHATQPCAARWSHGNARERRPAPTHPNTAPRGRPKWKFVCGNWVVPIAEITSNVVRGKYFLRL